MRWWRIASGPERVALAWWAAIGAIAMVAIPTETWILIGFDGVLMVGLGLFIALDVRGVASTLGTRRVGFGPFWQQQSAAWWRLSGGFLVVIGAGWTLAFGQAG